MSVFDDYVRKVEMQGGNSSNSLLDGSKKFFYEQFTLSPSYYQVAVDGKSVDSIINRTNNYGIKQIFFRYEYQPKVGSVIEYQETPHLLLEVDRDSMVVFGKMEECNGTINVQTGEIEIVRDGVDGFGRPKFKEVYKTEEVPCVIRDKYYSANGNVPLSLPEGRLEILMQHQEAPNIKVNGEINLYDRVYKIADISYVDVIDDVGIMRIHAERRDGKDG